MMIFGVVGNCLVCFVMFKFSYLRRTLSNYLIFSLAVSDLMVCISVLPLDIIYWLDFPRWTLGGYACNTWNSLFYTFLTASVMNLLIISGDRFIAIVYPLYYHTWVTFKVVNVAISSVWFYAVATGVALFLLLVPPDGEHYSFNLGQSEWFKQFLLIANVLAPFLIMTGLYLKIYAIARHHAQRINSSLSINSDDDNKKFRDTIIREVRLAKALGLIILCFVLCWLPYQVVSFLTLDEIIIEDCSVEIADTVTCWFAYLNSAVNPVLYAYTHRDFKRALRSILCRRVTDNDDDLRTRSRSRSRTSTLDQRRCTPPQQDTFNNTKL